MHKYILSVLALEKTITEAVVIPLYCTCDSHCPLKRAIMRIRDYNIGLYIQSQTPEKQLVDRRCLTAALALGSGPFRHLARDRLALGAHQECYDGCSALEGGPIQLLTKIL